MMFGAFVFGIKCLLLSHLAHSDEDPDDQDKTRNKDFTPIDKRGWPPTYLNSYILVYLLLFVSSFFESWDEIPFKGVGLSHPEISQF
jgi:hypothetical protein